MKKLFKFLAISFFTFLTGISIFKGSSFIQAKAAESTEVVHPRLERVSASPVNDVIKKIDIESIQSSNSITININETIELKTKIIWQDGINEQDYALRYHWDFSSQAVILPGATDDVSLIVQGVEKGSSIISVVVSVYKSGALVGDLKSTNSIYINVQKSFMQTVGDLLTSSTVLILAGTAAVTIIGRSAIKIFRFGVNYKSDFVTVEQHEKFEESVRKDLRANKTEMQDSILKICLREINRETRPLQDLQQMASQMSRDREVLNARMDSFDQRYNEIKKDNERILSLEQKVSRLQYGDTNGEIRRTGK